ncbi:hypothetical protein FHS78_001148 [Parvibaculum indicum]|uniref:hypothetical protein n=1 Tax=Parvibaculum indicum TaxID=562969 RepID=UPI001422B795|nr:hypothetical protein [Parvibaculum indicum]NIJ40872.1 hypothetical protein [Parvibaculum indicum]
MAQNFSIAANLNDGRTRKGLLAASAATVSAFLLAVTIAAPSVAQEKETAPNGDTVYKVTDEPDTPPVNYRSEQDPKYDTKEQHDAEMYAEQYEKERRKKQQDDKEQLERILDFSGGGTEPNSVNPSGDSMGRY